MADTLQSLTNGRLGVALALGLGRSLPPRLGYPVARRLGLWIASRSRSAQVRAVRLNQWVVSGGSLSAAELDQAVQQVFCLNARSLYDLYHNLREPEQILRLTRISPALEQLFEDIRHKKSAVVMACPHLSNFDLAGRVIAINNASIQLLSYANPGSGYEWQNELRREFGLEITPISPDALRMAFDRLEAGGAVLTGMDRPLPGSKYHPRFFGRPAALPTLHVRLALHTSTPVVVVACRTLPDKSYEIFISDPVRMVRLPDPHQEVVQNAETILGIVEDYIRQDPHQWAMFYPVWPEAQGEVP